MALLRLKRRVEKLKGNPIFAQLDTVQTKMLHLQRSMTMLNSQVQAIATGFDHVRASLLEIRTLGVRDDLARLKGQFRALLHALR